MTTTTRTTTTTTTTMEAKVKPNALSYSGGARACEKHRPLTEATPALWELGGIIGARTGDGRRHPGAEA